jgi:hypothetical protein
MPDWQNDRITPQQTGDQPSHGLMVDMAHPGIQDSFRPSDGRERPAVSENGQLIFDDPYTKNEGQGRLNDGQGGKAELLSLNTDQAGSAVGRDGGATAVRPLCDTVSTSGGSDAGSSTDQGTGAGASLDQLILSQLATIGAEIQQLTAELTQLLEGSGSGASESSDSSIPPTTTNPNEGTTTGATSGVTTGGTDSGSSGSTDTATNGSGSGTTGSTPAAPVDTNPAPTGPAGSGSSAIGPEGEAVGSTVTAFGPSAMPGVSDTAPAFYVSTDGSATGNGSMADPFATLQEAQQAMDGSSIKTTYVEGGTYNLSSSLNLTSADSGESFIADNNNGPVTLDGGGTASDLININGANDVSVEGFTMENTKPTSQLWTGADWFGLTSGDDAVLATNSTGDNFSDNAVHNVGIAFNLAGVSNSQVNGNDINNVDQGVNIMDGGNWAGPNNNTGNTVDSNRIENVSNISGVNGNYVGAIGVTRAVDATVDNNVVENTEGSAVEIQDSGYNGESVEQKDITVSGNTIENTNTAALPSENWNTTMPVESLHPFDNGAIYVTHGVGAPPDDLNFTIDNNYIVNAGAGISNYGIYLDDTVSGVNVDGNIVKAGGSASDVVIHGGSDDTVENNVLDMTSPTGQEKGIFLQSVSYQMQNNQIDNNIFYASGANGGGVYTDYHTGDAPTLSGNDYWGTSASGLSTESGASETNPQFIDPSSGNYSEAS